MEKHIKETKEMVERLVITNLSIGALLVALIAYIVTQVNKLL